MKEKEISAEDLKVFETRFAFKKDKLVYRDFPERRVGWKDKGYLRVKVDGKVFYQHRIIWFLHTGKWPVSDIDHIDGDKLNNSFENLRLATAQQNNMNRPQRKGKKLSRGVYWSKERQRFRSILCVDGVNRHLGYYDTEHDAREAYLVAAKNIFGEFVHDKT